MPDFFSQLSSIGDTLQANQRQSSLAELGRGLVDGTLDYKAAAGKAASLGDLGMAMQFMKMGEAQKADQGFINTFGGGQQSGTAPQAPPRPPIASPMNNTAAPNGNSPNNYGGAIAGIESGGNYQAVGPQTRTGDRALGKYQVMGANVGPWTKEILGQEMTPQQFLASPEAQEAVFKGKFGQYVQQYGNPQDAASAWFTGKPLAQGANRSDGYITGRQYVDRFNAGLQGGQQVASAGPVAYAPTNAGEGPAPAQPQVAPQQTAQAAPSQGLPPSAFTPQGGVNNPGDNIPNLIRAVANPYLSQGPREAAKVMLDKALDNTKLTNEQKDYYRSYVPQEMAAGRQPIPFKDYQIELKRAGATAITTDMRGENEYSKTMGKQFAEMNIEIAKTSNKARAQNGTINQLQTLLQDPGVYTGTSADTVQEVKRLGKAMGIDVAGVGPADAVRAISNQFALEMRNPAGGAGMPGALSDPDREFLQQIVPGLKPTREGNLLIADYMRRVNQRSIDVERLRQQYVRKNGRLDEGFLTALADYSDAHPVFPEAEAMLSKQPQQPQAQPQHPPQQQGAQPPVPGAKQAPDGNFYVPDPNRPGKYLRVK